LESHHGAVEALMLLSFTTFDQRVDSLEI